MGLLVPRGELPFVARVAYFAPVRRLHAGVLDASRCANSALTFAREGDRYRAPATRCGSTCAPTRRRRRVAAARVASEIVRVATFRETARADESVLFYAGVVLAPGRYTLALAVRDAGERAQRRRSTLPVTVPRLGAGAGLSTPVLAYEVDAARAPRHAAAPRGQPARHGRVRPGLAVVPVYVESYAAGGPSAGALSLQAHPCAASGATSVLWRDAVSSLRPPRRLALYSGVVRVPVSRIGIGVVHDSCSDRAAARRPDSVRAPLFVALGEELPVATFEEMVSYLRYYAAPERLRVLRDTAPEARAAAWAAFLRETDPVPSTAQHEGLREYFSRLRAANDALPRGGDAAAGSPTAAWRIIAFGEPDQILDPNGPRANVARPHAGLGIPRAARDARVHRPERLRPLAADHGQRQVQQPAAQRRVSGLRRRSQERTGHDR